MCTEFSGLAKLLVAAKTRVFRGVGAVRIWSGRRESNPHLKLGKLTLCR